MFLCENNDKNVTSATYDFYPDLNFFGAPKNNETVREFIDFMQRIISNDHTAQSKFLGDFDRFANKKIQNGRINMIPGIDVGIKSVEEEPILLEDLMSNNYLKIYPQTYGIWIPADQILNRRKYEWFARLSQKQVLESDTILGNYFLVNLGDGGANILEPLQVKPDWVGFYKTPLYPGLYMVSQPNMLGDNVPRVPYTGR
jgi:hypothetical protein